MELILITGGARAGKSRYAQARAVELGGDDVSFIATATASDDEMRARIERHRADRPARWECIEAPAQIGAAIAECRHETILLDCVTMLAANALLRAHARSGAEAEDAVAAEVHDIVNTLTVRSGTLLAVTNEVGLSVHPPTALGRWYQDALGRANQRLAASAAEVVLVVSGLPLVLKGASRRA